MARNNIVRVPPPTKWPLRFQIVSDAIDKSADLDNAFTTVEDAFKFLHDQPASRNPWNGIPWTGEVSPGLYLGKVWIPNSVFLHSPNPLSVRFAGGPDVLTDEAIVSVANGGLRNFFITPQGTTGIPSASLFVRDSTYLYTYEDYNWIGSLTDKTLVFLIPSGITITFTGTEIDASSVAAKITADGLGQIDAIAQGNRVVIRNTTPSGTLKIDRDGTANSALGFFTDFDLASIANAQEFMVGQNLVLTGASGQDKVLWLTDQGGGQYVIDGASIAGGVNGTYADVNSRAIIRSGFNFFNQNGIYVDDDAILELEGGRSNQNTANDIHIQPTAKVFARGNFSYEKRIGSGELIPSGSRSPDTFAIAGNIAVTDNLDGIRPADYDQIIESVTLTRETAGQNGQTVIQLTMVAEGGATTPLYTTTPQPQVLASAGNFVFVSAALPDILQIPKGNGLKVEITEKETGLPQGLTVKVRLSVSA